MQHNLTASSGKKQIKRDADKSMKKNGSKLPVLAIALQDAGLQLGLRADESMSVANTPE